MSGNTPFGLANSGRMAAVIQTGNSLRLKRRHVCIWHKVVPVKTVNHPCSEMRVNLQPGEEVGSGHPCYQLIFAWERPGNFSGPNPNFKSKPVEEQHSSYLTNFHSSYLNSASLNNSFIFRLKKKRTTKCSLSAKSSCYIGFLAENAIYKFCFLFVCL